nr:hypothetical protein [Candidatus Sigynarchaeota archaeon]
MIIVDALGALYIKIQRCFACPKVDKEKALTANLLLSQQTNKMSFPNGS